MPLSRRLAALLSVAVWLAGRVAVACSAPCQPAVSPAVDPDVPTDIGVLLTQTVGGCGDPEPLVKDVRVVDAGGQLVPGRLVTVAFRKGSIWKPHAPLIPGAAYELQETAPPGRRFPFTAGPGPAPVLDASALALVASPVLATLANVCCGESHGGSCGRDAGACAASDAQNG